MSYWNQKPKDFETYSDYKIYISQKIRHWRKEAKNSEKVTLADLKKNQEQQGD